MAKKASIRRATLDDRDSVLAILPDCYQGYDYLPDRYSAFVTSENNVAFVSELPVGEDGKLMVVGFLLLTVIDGGETVLFRAKRVSEHHQGRGIMFRMEKHAFDFIIRNFENVQFHRFGVAKVGTTYLMDPTWLRQNRILKAVRVLRYLADFDAVLKHSSDKESSARVKDLSDKEALGIFAKPEEFKHLKTWEHIMLSYNAYKQMPENFTLFRKIELVEFAGIKSNSGKLESLSLATTYINPKNNMIICTINLYCPTQEHAEEHLVSWILKAVQKNRNFSALLVMVLFCSEDTEMDYRKFSSVAKSRLGLDIPERFDFEAQMRDAAVTWESTIKRSHC